MNQAQGSQQAALGVVGMAKEMNQAHGSQQAALAAVGMVAYAFLLARQSVSRDTNPLCCSQYIYYIISSLKL